MTETFALQRFVERLDDWTEMENPDDDLRLEVLSWIFTRIDHPYANAKRENAVPNL